MGQPPRELLERVRETIQRKHYSIRTETAYVNWIKRYLLFPKAKQGLARHPRRGVRLKSRHYSPTWR